VNAEKLLEIRDRCKQKIADMPLELLAECWQAIQQIEAIGRKDIPPIPPDRPIQ
jgi:hypothetical protein